MRRIADTASAEFLFTGATDFAQPLMGFFQLGVLIEGLEEVLFAFVEAFLVVEDAADIVVGGTGSDGLCEVWERFIQASVLGKDDGERIVVGFLIGIEFDGAFEQFGSFGVVFLRGVVFADDVHDFGIVRGEGNGFPEPFFGFFGAHRELIEMGDTEDGFDALIIFCEDFFIELAGVGILLVANEDAGGSEFQFGGGGFLAARLRDFDE